jgi:hypothetical protein
VHDPLKFVPTEPAWWTASAGHLLGEKENEAAMNRFPEPLLTGVVPDYDAFLWQRHKLIAAKIEINIETVWIHGAFD